MPPARYTRETSRARAVRARDTHTDHDDHLADVQPSDPLEHHVHVQLPPLAPTGATRRDQQQEDRPTCSRQQSGTLQVPASNSSTGSPAPESRDVAGRPPHSHDLDRATSPSERPHILLWHLPATVVVATPLAGRSPRPRSAEMASLLADAQCRACRFATSRLCGKLPSRCPVFLTPEVRYSSP